MTSLRLATMRAIVLVSLLQLLADPVFAMGEDDRVIHLRASGDLTPRPGVRGGAGAGLALAMGVSDAWGIRIGADLAWLPKQGEKPRYLSSLSVCASLALDALAWVPYVDLGPLLSDFRDRGRSSQWLGARMEAGMEYLLSPHASLTIATRADWLLLHLAGQESSRPLHFAVLFGAARLF